LRDCHARDIYHGDIKAQNVLVTSWNWLYLADFSSAYKPAFLPDDNPADFTFYFDSEDTGGERTCNVAPERFLPRGERVPEDGKLTWAMDVFSAGCVIAQLFSDSDLFNLERMLKFRRGEFDPAISLLKIADKDVREMIGHMVQLDPERRYSAEQYLEFWRKKVFPEYFYNFLHQYMGLITDPSSGNNPVSNSLKNLGEPDERINRVFYDFDKISYFLGYHDGKRHQAAITPAAAPMLGPSPFPMRLNIPSHQQLVSAMDPPEDDGTLIFLTLVVSSVRNTARASSKMRACDILLAFSERLTDEAKLDRVLPYLISLLGDKSELVVVTAIRAITQLVQMVHVVMISNVSVFSDYVLPRFSLLMFPPQSSNRERPSPMVRATYASCIGSLATAAANFLELVASLKGTSDSFAVADPEVEPTTTAGEMRAVPESSATAALDSLINTAEKQIFAIFELHTKSLAEDTDIYVRRAFLTSVPELCLFFGPAESNDILLTHLNTYLNDRDWMLKSAFFEAIVAIATLVGTASLEDFILPLMIQALADPEEFVVQAALHSLAQLSSLGLLSRPKIWELIDVVSRFTMHPNRWIREAAADFLSSSSKFMSTADKWCIIHPMIKPYLKPDIMPEFSSELTLLDTLKKPLSRSVFEQALMWASKSEKSLFWKSLKQIRSLTFGNVLLGSSPRSSASTPSSLSKVSRNEEDDQWLSRLRNLGLSVEDEHKLLALREFIWRLSKMRSRDPTSAGDAANVLGEEVKLMSLGAKLQTVFFDDEPLHQSAVSPSGDSKAPYTIADALLDASMTIDDDPVGKRRKAALNSHRARTGNMASVSPHPMDRLQRRDSKDSTRRAPLQLLQGSGRIGASSSSPTNDDASSTYDRSPSISSRHSIRHQSSALSLLDRRDSNKTIPEALTSEVNAFGQVEGPFSQIPQSPIKAGSAEQTPTSRPNTAAKIKVSHTYEGTDPSILKMLDAMFVDNYPHDIVEFGPLVTPISRRKMNRSNTGGSTGSQVSEPWRPGSRLVATFAEHTGAINRVVPSPDHVFFITGGDDGAVKVWDTARLERNITHRSRQAHRHAPGAKVLALCFIENTHCFISCGSDGSAHVVKVDTAASSGSLRYPRLRLLREYRLPEGEWAVWVEHFKIESSSVMVLATNRSRILGIDLRTMTLLYVLENPVHHGTPTCFCVDRKRNWLCVGTSHGVIDLWDLRFKMRLKAWGVPGKGSIYRMCVHPIKGRGKWVCVAGGTGQGEVTVWDLEKTTCREIYRVGGNKDGPKGYEAWEVDEDKGEGMLGRFATQIETSSAAGTGNADRGVRAMVAGTTATEDGRDVRHAFMVTGGSDKKLRYWDLPRIENSVVYSGLQPDEPAPTFAPSQIAQGMTLNTEKMPRQSSKKDKDKDQSKAKAARSTVISMQQQQLLRSHLDSILDVALLESPYTMTVSVDRSGVVFVFQ